jgi:hypothetical protein
MTPFRQIDSNRRNALSSTGPKTEAGKQRSSKNAVRHGLTAETVIEALEDPEDYKAFEQAITADYDAETVVERELVLRLASLLWRLRRSTLIETGLLQIQSDILSDVLTPPTKLPTPNFAPVASLRLGTANIARYPKAINGDHAIKKGKAANAITSPELSSSETGLDIALRFLRLSDLDNNILERLGRYETALWRQVRQTIFSLEGLRWRLGAHSRRRARP